MCISCAKQPVKEVPVPVPTYVFFIPEKIVTPDKPVFKEYDKTKLLNQSPNFERLQQNTVMLKNYSNSLRLTIDKYEQLIDEMQETKARVESGNASLPASTERLKQEVTPTQ